MKKIKFRGLAIADFTGKPITEKKFVYGNVWTNEDNSCAVIGEHKDKNGMSNHYGVDPDSVVQFVGYDSDDNEIYEGDELIDSAGHEWTAVLLPKAEMDCGGVYEWLYGKEKFRLKGRGKNENLS